MYKRQALVYYNLVNLYGGIPLVLQETSNPTDYFGQGRASVQEIFNQIIIDLTEASSSLPESNDIGRANKAAALILLGKAHLTVGNAAEAETALRGVTGYPFINTYADLFGIDNENINQMVSQFNKIILEKNNLLVEATEKNPLVIQSQNQLVVLRSNILNSCLLYTSPSPRD